MQLPTQPSKPQMTVTGDTYGADMTDEPETGPPCPACAAVSYRLEYGMPAPGSDLTYNRGCMITPGHDPDYVCSSCDLEWLELDSGRPIVTFAGEYSLDQLRTMGLLKLDDLIAAGSSLELTGKASVDMPVVVTAGQELGLTAEECSILLFYR